MRWYKILARIPLMLSIIVFALAAPVVIQEHKVRVSGVDAAKDRTATRPLRRDSSNKWLANAAYQTNVLPVPRSSDSGHWRKQEPRQHNPRPRTDPGGSPEPSNQGQPMNPDNPPLLSPHPGPGSTSPRPTSQALTDEPDLLNPSSSHGNTDLNPSPHKGQGPTDDTHASNPASPSLSRPLRPDPSDDDIDMNFKPQSSSQKFKSLSELFSSTLKLDAPRPDHSQQFVSSSDVSHSSSSGVSPASMTEESYPNSPDQSSTDKSHPPAPGPTDNNPPPASPENPGSSTEPKPPQSGKRPRPEDHESGSFLSKILKEGRFKRRFSGSRALNAARNLQGTFNSRA